MPERIEFETPENVRVGYEPAGLGSRFLAWFVDSMLLVLLFVVILILLVLVGLGSHEILDRLAEGLSGFSPESGGQLSFYFMGIFLLVWGLGSFFYYGLSEYFLRGETIGKRQVSIRTVKADGFSLDAGSILVRNIFRIIDHVPALWIVPLVSARSQRLGDLVAGTVVVKDEPSAMSPLREQLLQRPPADAAFRFDATILARVRPADVEAAEAFLERVSGGGLRGRERNRLLATICEPLAKRLGCEPPAARERRRFLEDFLAAEVRRQYRKLG